MLAMTVLRIAIGVVLFLSGCNAMNLRLGARDAQRSVSRTQLKDLSRLAFGEGNQTQVDPLMMVHNLEKQLSGSAKGDGDDAENPDKVDQVLQQMLETVNQSHDAAVQQSQDLITAFSTCSVNQDAEKAELVQSKGTVDGKADAHKTCRTAEDPLYDQKNTCNAELKKLIKTKETVCDAVDDMEEDPGQAADVCHSQGEKYGDWLERNWHHFEAKAKKFRKAEEACKNATQEVDAKTPICKQLDEDFDLKKEACDQAQDQLESATCSYGVEYIGACDGLSACWTNALSAYNNAKDGIASGVVSRKASWRAMMRMRCLVGTFGESDQDEAIDTCINKTHDTSHLDIDLAPPPSEPTCEIDEPLPCSAAFKSKHYANLPVGGQAKTECAQCAISTTAEEGWVLVMKIDGADQGLGYDDPLWSNDELLNAESAHSVPGTAKYERYLNTGFREIKVCVGGMNMNCIRTKFSSEWHSTKDLFSVQHQIAQVPASDVMSAFEASGGQCAKLGMNMGFNVQCDAGVKARFGYCAAPGDACEPWNIRSAIGIGLCNLEMGASVEPKCTGPTAGYGGAFSDDGQASAANVWVWVKETTSTSLHLEQNGWTLIGKLAAMGHAGYDDPYWTTDDLLHEDEIGQAQPVQNVKYPAWVNKSFSQIRVCAKKFDFGTNVLLSDFGGCAEYHLDKTYTGATELFTSGMHDVLPQGSSADNARWEKVFGITPGSKPCGPTTAGINAPCGNGYAARIGECISCTSGQCDAAGTSGAVGVGLKDPKTVLSAQYLGCYKDNGDRDLPVKKVHSGSNLEECSQLCAGYKYFGLQWKRQCWCGDSYGKHGPSNSCQAVDAYNIGDDLNRIYTEGQTPAGYTDSISGGFTHGFSCENSNAKTHLDHVWLWVK